MAFREAFDTASSSKLFDSWIERQTILLILLHGKQKSTNEEYCTAWHCYGVEIFGNEKSSLKQLVRN